MTSTKIDDLVASKLSHEIRNSLSIIDIQSKIIEKILEKSDFEQKIKKSTKSIKQAIKSIEALTSDLAVLNGELGLDIEVTNFSEKLTENLACLEALADGRNLIAEIKDDIYLNVDFQRIFQVIINLVKNATEATQSGKRIFLRVYQADDEAIIEVEDEGSGVKELEKVFDIGYSSKKSGLGLAVSKEIVHLHDGIISAKNTPRGAMFSFRLPALAHSIA